MIFFVTVFNRKILTVYSCIILMYQMRGFPVSFTALVDRNIFSLGKQNSQISLYCIGIRNWQRNVALLHTYTTCFILNFLTNNLFISPLISRLFHACCRLYSQAPMVLCPIMGPLLKSLLSCTN